MAHLPSDPFARASKRDVRMVIIASLITSVAFFVFAALAIRMTAKSGRLGLPPVIFLNALLLAIGICFLAIAITVFRGQKKPDPQLMGSATLFLIGGFLLVLPLAIAVVMVLTHSYQDAGLLLMHVVPISGLGILTIRLAHLRRKRPTPPK
jgi:hypothetical protein